MKTVVLAVLLTIAVLPLAASLARAEDTAPTPPDVLGDREFLRSNYTAAEKYYREALAAHPDDMHSLTRLATLLNWRGGYAEAIDLYQRGLRQDPSSMELKRGLATSLTWSEQYGKALTLYREMLATRPGDEGITFEMAQAQAWSGDNAAAKDTLHEMVSRNPRHIKGRLLLAQVHAWTGEPVAAERIYRSLLAEDPGNVAALAGLGDSLNAQGRNDEAQAAYARALAIDPKNRTALEGRARVFQSQGRTPQALEAVRQALELYPDARDARRLGREIGGPLRPSLQLFASTNQDSDDNDLAQWGGIYTHYLGGRGYVGASFTHAQTNGAGEFDDSAPVTLPMEPANTTARYDTLRAIGGVHFSPHFSLYAEAGPERTIFPFVNAGPESSNEVRRHAAGSLTLEINGADWFTLVASASQERLVGTTQAFVNDVGIRAATLTTIFRPHPSLKLRLTGQKAEFTDNSAADLASNLGTPEVDRNNHRALLSAGASWRLPVRAVKITLSCNARWMAYYLDVDHGYFHPDQYLSDSAGFDLSDTIGHNFYWGVGADRGVQRIDHNGGDDTFSYRGLAGVNLGDSASFEAYFAHSNSALTTASGFNSTEGGVRLVFKFGATLGPALPARPGPADSGGKDD
ncbi:MAG TPA: tetratricopeptide repeat protein [Patescibacteria group bacterium]|nr:tetratricopeptide repeat protein [Patescibacteria group bacterium]